jgi:hypothetical protein
VVFVGVREYALAYVANSDAKPDINRVFMFVFPLA